MAVQPLDAPVVLLPLALLPGILLADVIVPQGPHSYADAIRTLAETHAVAPVASARRLLTKKQINDMQAALALTGATPPEAAALIRRLAEERTAAVDRDGATAWCSDAHVRYGQSGTVMKGLLKRCDPRAARGKGQCFEWSSKPSRSIGSAAARKAPLHRAVFPVLARERACAGVGLAPRVQAQTIRG